MKKYILLSLSVLLLILLAGPVRAFAIEISADVVKTGGSEQAHLSKTYIKGDKYRMEMPYDPKLKPKVDGKFKGEVSKELISSESTDGHPTQKYEVTLKEGIKTEKFYEWTAIDINFPIKKAAIDGSWSDEYKNIQYSVSDSLFEIPAGFKKISIPAIR